MSESSDGFGEQLEDDAAAAGADRGANGELMLARGTARQQQDGDIAAADDEQQGDRSAEQR